VTTAKGIHEVAHGCEGGEHVACLCGSMSVLLCGSLLCVYLLCVYLLCVSLLCGSGSTNIRGIVYKRIICLVFSLCVPLCVRCGVIVVGIVAVIAVIVVLIVIVATAVISISSIVPVATVPVVPDMVPVVPSDHQIDSPLYFREEFLQSTSP
jgi:hypothetical protein